MSTTDPTSTPSPSSVPPTQLPVPTTIDPPLGAALQAIVDEAVERIPTPGISVAIRLPSGELWTGVAGQASITPARPITTETVFGIASITKTFVTALIMQLAEEGALTLDDRLALYLPDFPRAARVSLRHLLSHTSGIYDYFTNPRYVNEVYADTSRAWTFDEILDFVGAPYCDPGSCYHYSNTNFVLLGRVAEIAGGKPLHTLIRKRLLDPLGLTDTVFQPYEQTPLDHAHGHLISGTGYVDHTGMSRIVPHRSAVTVAWAAGAMASNPSDLARWADALYGGEVVSADALAQMIDFQPPDGYGLGTRSTVFSGRLAAGHLGGIRGFESAMWHFMAEDVTIVVCTNRGRYSTGRTVRMLTRTLMGPAALP